MKSALVTSVVFGFAICFGVSTQVLAQPRADRRPEVCANMFLSEYVAMKKITSWDLFALRWYSEKGTFPQNDWGLPEGADWQNKVKALANDFVVLSEKDTYLAFFRNVRVGDLLVIGGQSVKHGGVFAIEAIDEADMEVYGYLYDDEADQLSKKFLPLSLDPEDAPRRFLRPFMTVVRLKNNKYCPK